MFIEKDNILYWGFRICSLKKDPPKKMAVLNIPQTPSFPPRTVAKYGRRHWNKRELLYLKNHPEMTHEAIGLVLSRTDKAIEFKRWQMRERPNTLPKPKS